VDDLCCRLAWEHSTTGGLAKVEEPADRKVRAQLLDESLEILIGLWSGKPFGYRGEHYRLEEMAFLPPPIQSPRIPIWAVAAWPSEKSMRRALNYDGLLAYNTHGEVAPEDIRAMKAYVEENRPEATPFDIVWEGEKPGDDPKRAAQVVRPSA
jgi:alkanesulfonate monooxygenase SsuD/methylene tetrahydromethanopterin reductase-like flavin-dependent oxidoreductase (luciferase family)